MPNPLIWGFSAAMNMLFTPMWLVFFLGVIVGWLWKPNWATSLAKSFDFASPFSCSPVFSPLKFYSSSSSPFLNSSITMQTPNPDSLGIKKDMNKKASSSSTPTKYDSSSGYFLFHLINNFR